DDRLRELFRPRLDDADFDLLRQVHISHQLSGEALELISDLPRLAGSNAWAVAPKRSASGNALLASDPHLEVNRLPAIWYEAVLKWQDRYLLGATLPGCPFVGVGRNPDLAWGVTYLKGDTSDYFIEDCRRGGSTGWQYRRGDAWHDFEARREVIERKSAEPEELTIFHNQQGTLDSSPGADDPAGYYLSVAWTGNFIGSGKAIETWLHLAQATTAAEAMQIVRVSPQPTLNWIFADRDGHIGKQASGWFPVRSSKYTGLLPIPAWDEANHWHGWHSPNMLPGVLDPPSGFVATANEDISPPGGPLLTTYPVPAYRKRRLDEVLAAMPTVTLLEMQQLQYDVLSLQARDMLAIFLPHLADGELKQRLTDWDLRYDPASVEASIYQELYRNVLLEIFGQSREEGGIGWRRMLYLSSRSGFSTMVLAAVDELLNRETSLWWKHRKKGDLIRAAAEKVNLADAQPWSEVNSFHFANRFFQSDRVGRLFGFNTPAMPMRGCYATLFQGHLFQVATRATTFAPSYHLVTDLAEDEVHTNLPGGPSESRFSRYYRNDIPLWQEGKYKVLRPWGTSDAAKTPG
ncbi:MAG: penicillin acylase family protein, partial [Pirellulales bacterium]